MGPVWDKTAPPDVLGVLDPGMPEELGRSPDVLVVGGGILGLATAAMCVRARLGSVVVLERGRLAGGTSGSAAGFLSPDSPLRTHEGFIALARRSLDLTRELDADWGFGLRDVDWIVRTPGEHLIPRQALVHPLRLAAAFAQHAGAVATGVDVHGFDGREVRTSHGSFTPQAVVFATGMAPDGASVPQSLVKGHLIATEPAPFRLDEVITSTATLVLQAPDGRLVAGGTVEPDDHDAVVRETVVDAIRSELVELVPEADGLEVTHRWCCFRPAVADELPVIDRIPGAENAWFTAGHYRTGLLMAAATGRAIAGWIETGAAPAGIETFASERFA